MVCMYVCNATWHLCLLPPLVKGCMISFQLSCNQVATNRQSLWRQWGGFLSGFLFIPWITKAAMPTQSFGCALLRGLVGCIFPLKGSLWSFQGSTLIKQLPYLSPSVLYFRFILSRMNLDHSCFTKMLFWQLSRATSDRQCLLSCIANWKVKKFYSSSWLCDSWNRSVNIFSSFSSSKAFTTKKHVVSSVCIKNVLINNLLTCIKQFPVGI